MSRPRTLNDQKDLKEVGFGKPSPRHGLKLLYWFANECLVFDNNNQMRWRFNPEERHFGFKLYRNTSGLLPASNLKYYEMGNLREATGVSEYVRADYNQNQCNSNKDRIMVRVKGVWFDEVYVTEHNHGRNDFNKKATYFISRGLIMSIKRMTLQDFLTNVGYFSNQEYSVQRNEDTVVNIDPPESRSAVVVVHDDPPDRNNKPKSPCSCTIL